MRMKDEVVCSLALSTTMAARLIFFLVSLQVLWHHTVAKTPLVKTSLKYHTQSGKFSFKHDGEGDTVASAQFSNSINQTGWAYLHLETNDTFPDYVQAYAAGLLEGNVTRDLIKMHWNNTLASYCPMPFSDICAKIFWFLEQNLLWMKNMIAADTKRPYEHMPFWHHVELFLYQAAGLADGVNGKEKEPNIDIDPMSFYLFQVDGDTDDLQEALNDGKTDRPLGSGSCSALVKLLPGNADLYTSQDTWNHFNSMLRILKVYNFPWKMSASTNDTIPGRIQAFSSYPGTLNSGDDFYLLSSGLVSMETTIGNNNPALWKYVKSSTVLESIRSVVANRLAKSGEEWARVFSYINSGTYNNEWMIVDYKRFQPGMKSLPPGLLTVLDQIPGSIEYADLTPLLVQQGYFPSYNSPYFPKIFNASGNQANVEKYGDWFSYDKTPRALIFKRDHVKVKDLQSMAKLMRYNDFTHDPLSKCNCTPPYSGENAISARSDLNPANGTYPFGALGHRMHGGIDMKLTSSALFQSLSFIAQGGPTWDQQPPFQWSRSPFSNVSHIGQPDLWEFAPILFNSTAIFGRL